MYSYFLNNIFQYFLLESNAKLQELVAQIEKLKEENQAIKKEKEEEAKLETKTKNAKNDEKIEKFEIPLLQLSKLKISDPEEKLIVRPNKLQISMISKQDRTNLYSNLNLSDSPYPSPRQQAEVRVFHIQRIEH